MPTRKIQALLRRVGSSSGPEQAFWKSVASQFHEARPNWGVDLNTGRAPLGSDAFVYLVDTGTLWIAAASVAPAQLVALRDEEGAGEERQVNRARAAAAMHRASTRSASAGDGAMSSPGTLHAIGASLRAIATSPAFAAASAQAPVLDDPHWILMLYRLADGELITGLGQVSDPYPGMLDRGTLLECVEGMVEMDIGTRGTIVNAEARQHGGVSLAPELAHIQVA